MKSKNFFYYGRKIILFLFSLWALSLVVFYIAHLIPGDPLVSYYGERVEKMSGEERLQAEERLGLNAPVHVQYIRWLGNALQGDLGISFKYKMDVRQVIKGRIGNTLLLGGMGFGLIFVLSLLLGILCAQQEGKMIDRILCQLGTVVSCIPEFWMSLWLIYLFAICFPLLPLSGAYDMGEAENVWGRIRHLILPVTVVVMGHLWYFAYLIRNKILEEIRADYILLAKAKGLDRRKIMSVHCLPNVFPSYLSIMAVSVSHILGGTYVVEMVFSYPGIGTLAYESARYQDYNLLMVLCMLSGAVVIFCNIAAQTVSERMDPRIRAVEGDKDFFKGGWR